VSFALANARAEYREDTQPASRVIRTEEVDASPLSAGGSGSVAGLPIAPAYLAGEGHPEGFAVRNARRLKM